jgi:hypothetical protein
LLFENGLSLLFDLVLVSLDDGAGEESDVFDLRLVLRFGGVFTVVVEPILLCIS